MVSVSRTIDNLELACYARSRMEKLFSLLMKVHSHSYQKGQTLLIVVLVMVVSLSIGLSLASRTITNLRNTAEEESSQRAFSAAEAGIEQALKEDSGLIGGETFSEGTQIKEVTVTEIEGTEFLLNGGNPVQKDDGLDIWIADYSEDGSAFNTTKKNANITLFWGENSDPCENAAIEIIVLSGANKDNATSTRYAYDPCDVRNSQNQFAAPSSANNTIEGKRFYNSASIVVTNGFIARVVPLYQSDTAAVSSNVALPPQGKKISSVGQSDNTVRKITFFQGYPSVPTEFFPYILFSSVR